MSWVPVYTTFGDLASAYQGEVTLDEAPSHALCLYFATVPTASCQSNRNSQGDLYERNDCQLTTIAPGTTVSAARNSFSQVPTSSASAWLFSSVTSAAARSECWCAKQNRFFEREGHSDFGSERRSVKLGRGSSCRDTFLCGQSTPSNPIQLNGLSYLKTSRFSTKLARPAILLLENLGTNSRKVGAATIQHLNLREKVTVYLIYRMTETNFHETTTPVPDSSHICVLKVRYW